MYFLKIGTAHTLMYKSFDKCGSTSWMFNLLLVMRQIDFYDICHLLHSLLVFACSKQHNGKIRNDSLH